MKKNRLKFDAIFVGSFSIKAFALMSLINKNVQSGTKIDVGVSYVSLRQLFQVLVIFFWGK